MKISQLPVTTTVNGTEVLPIVQSGTTKKVTIADALAGAGGIPDLQAVTDQGATTNDNILITQTGDINSGIMIQPNTGLSAEVVYNQYKVGNDGLSQASIVTTVDIDNIKSSVIQLNANNNVQNNNLNSYLQSYSDALNDNSYGLIGMNKQKIGVNEYFNLELGNNITPGFNAILKYDNYNIGGSFISFSESSISTYNYGIGGIGSSAHIGLNLDFGSGIYYLGDFINDDGIVLSSTSYLFGKSSANVGVQLNWTNDTFIFGNFISTKGFVFDYSNNKCFIGDPLGNNNGTVLIIDDANLKGSISAFDEFYIYSNGSGFKSNGTNLTTTIGDYDISNNGSIFGVDDVNQTLFVSNNLIVNTSGGTANKHIKVNIGGADYVIELKLP